MTDLQSSLNILNPGTSLYRGRLLYHCRFGSWCIEKYFLQVDTVTCGIESSLEQSLSLVALLLDMSFNQASRMQSTKQQRIKKYSSICSLERFHVLKVSVPLLRQPQLNKIFFG